MTDSEGPRPGQEPPNVDRFGEPAEKTDEGALLFDPGGYEPPEDDDFGLPAPRRSWAPVLAISAIAVIVVGIFGYRLMSGSEPVAEGPVDAPIMVTPIDDSAMSAAVLQPIPTDHVEGPIGSSVRVAVRALAPGGAGMADTLVVFAVESGNGRLDRQEARTSPDGIAVTFLRLPQRPGRTIVTASLPGSELDDARITATALPGPPEDISIVSGDDQEAEIGRLIPSRAFVRVVDAEGNPVPGVLVTFRVGSGEGMTAPSQTETDSLGQASALWRLGMVEGEQTLIASASGLGERITFRATGTPQATLEIDNPAPVETSAVTVARRSFVVGGSHTCSLRGGSLRCRGANDRGQAAPSGSLDFVSIAAGSSHTCALSASGVASCWGANEGGQLGDGSRDDRSSPVRVRTELRFSTLAAGEAHTCGLAGGGVPLCWGQNLSGQIGDGTRNDQLVPRTVGGGLAFREITAGWEHTCGLTASGNTFCWGLNSQGQLGDGTNLDRLTPTLVRSAVQRLVAGSAHTCGISQGRVFCWGANTFGQVGDGSTENRSQPVAVEGLPGSPTDLSAGAVHTCALVSDGRAFCWGQNRQGQLGDGTNENRATPVAVAGDLRFSSIHAGGAQTCGIARDGSEYCWGLNQSGQLGDGTRTNRATPTRVSG